MYEDFTPKAERAIAQAKLEACQAKMTRIALSDLLVGLSQIDCLASKVLRTFNLTKENFRNSDNMSPSQALHSFPDSAPQDEDFSPDVRRIISIGRKTCSLSGHTYIGTEHLLLAILLDDAGASLMTNLGANPERICNYTLRLTGRLNVDYAELRKSLID